MVITQWAYGTQLAYDRTSYIVYEGTLETPQAKSFVVVYNRQEGLAGCLTCGHFDCQHSIFVQDRMRHKHS